MIAIADYGMGNLKSLKNALNYIGSASVITQDGNLILKSDAVIIPGVGAFPDAMSNMKKTGLDRIIKTAVSNGKPVLGICLGMQLMFEEGEEITKCSGLNLIDGTIKRIKDNVKVPHMGWNSLKIKKSCPLIDGIEDGSYVYFVHSYYAEIKQYNVLNAYTTYGTDIPAVISSGNLYGTQFHPEKSGSVGLKILKNFRGLLK